MTPTEDKILRFTDEALEQASELSERWEGTLVGNILDMQQQRLRDAIQREDLSKALIYLADLAQTINYAEEQ